MKLLDRSIRNYLLFSALLTIFFTPLFYFAIQRLFINELDEVLRAHKRDFYESIAHLKTEQDLALYHIMNKEFILTPTTVIQKTDTLFTKDALDEHTNKVVPHRVFATGVILNGQNYQLQIRESLVSAKGLITAIMGTELLLLLLMLIGFTLINRNLSRIIWTPFYRTLEKLKRYQIDQDSDFELPRSSTAEFRDLADVITQLVNKNHEAYLNQKEFTENASHELQTPLTIWRTNLEMLSQTKELTQEQAEIVGTLADTTDRISRLNKNLFLLSKIENRQFSEIEPVDINNVVAKCLVTYGKQADAKGVNLKYNFHDQIIVKTNAMLMEVLVSNLVSNAIKHSKHGGQLSIKCSKMTLTFSNTGHELTSPDKLFHRFYRESRDTTGSGLGLALVKKICDVAGFKIQYHFQDAMHHFIISF